jgi:NADH-quinone oxidoreductase E subunit
MSGPSSLPTGPHGEMAPDVETFEFSAGSLERVKAILAKYPPARKASAVLPLLHVAQAQHGGWLPRAALDYVADFLEMPRIRVYEVASFYDMYNTRPVGRVQVRVCTTTPCWLRGSDDIVRACKDELGCGIDESSADGRFFLREFECLGACANAPILWIDDEYYEDLTYDGAKDIIQALKRGEQPAPGSKLRRGAMPEGGKTSLLEPVEPWKRSLEDEPKEDAAATGPQGKGN